MSHKQITVNGQIRQNEKGFYWCLEATFEGLDKHLFIDSSRSGTYFDDQTKAREAVVEAGKELARQLADVINDLTERRAAYVLDKSNMH